jgi:hypothetical protein
MKRLRVAAAKYAEGYTHTAVIEQTFGAGAVWAYRWIPVEQELPEDKNEKVLIKYRNAKNEEIIVVEDFNYVTEECQGVKITHWRQIELKVK